GDYWESWGPYGECSRSCGSGVTMRTRRCITQTDGGHNCVGPDKSYRSCNIQSQDCPEGSKDFREEQCSQFDGTDFQGKRYKWLPYYGENPCELNCMPRGENFYYRHRSAVVDGTPCHPGRRDICVDGVCKRLGCDNMLDSPQQEDPCLQCGGNGQSCYQVKNSFNVRDLTTYNQMFIIPVGATTISIRETVATRNYLIKNLRGEYYLNGHWVIEFSRSTPIAGTVLYYQRGAEGDNVPETIIGRGPTTEPLVVEEPNQGVEYEYYLPNGRSRNGYYWSFGSWSACSRECGSYQSRLVFCTIDNEAYPDYLCASLPRPQTNRTCNPHPCPQVRMAYLYPPQLWRSSERPRAFVFWKTGEWNACSVTCGGGSQVRSVQCISHDASGPRVVEDAVCAAYAEAPPTLQTCNMHKCAEYCSVTCGPGEQTREVTCVGSGGMRLEETSCSTLLRPSSVQPCQMVACSRQISWHVGQWGLCSRSCGSGSRERQVICSDQERNLYPVDQCNGQPKPTTVERCNSQPCYSPQVPSVQDPRGHDNSQTGFQPYVPDHATPTQTNSVQDPHSSAPALHCSQSYYGCCPDGRTSAGGPQGLGCPHAPAPTPAPTPALPPAQPSCIQTYGCCQDGVTAAQGLNREGCLPRAAGSCSSWVSRYHFDVITSKCVQFWYGSCHGNSNNFMTRAECQRACPLPSPSLTLGGVSIDKSDPSTVEALVGQTVVLPCRVSPPPSSTVVVEWRRDG
uniref:Papilin, proteoglycan like sulfated glycoprotein n=1 Tax=Amphiprion percula TaxID=161767 RepID=A0A3P8SCA0_AMPPE